MTRKHGKILCSSACAKMAAAEEAAARLPPPPPLPEVDAESYLRPAQMSKRPK